ncbi:hypothetical protein ABPG75_006572 [Micractinium tetrahymenae]
MLARLQPKQAWLAGRRPDLLPTAALAHPRRRRTTKPACRSRWTAAAKAAGTAVAGALLLFVLAVVLPALPPGRLWPWPHSVSCQQGQEVVISLATVAQRLTTGGPFPVALRALLRQTAGDCASIWVFLPRGDRAAAEAAAPALDAAARRAGRLVRLHFVPDRMSANKFLWALEALAHPEPGAALAAGAADASNAARQHSRFRAVGTSWRPAAEITVVLGLPSGQPQPSTQQLQAEVARLRAAPGGGPLLLVCDDDFVHHPRLLETLLAGRQALLASGRQGGASSSSGGGSRGSGSEVAVGTRGYRVRPDFTWGVLPAEFDRHVTEGWRIASPYQTGVATSGKGILFHPQSALGAFNLSDFGEAPGGAHFVDDIWLNGHLAAAGVPRWVVPLPGEPADMQVNGDSPLDRRLARQQLSRWQANSDAIRFFQAAWEPGLLYRMGGAGGPRLRPALQRALLRARSAWALLLVRAGLL